MIPITIISIACAALALVIFFRYGREYRPKFTEKYWRDVPARDVHPAVVTRIWNWNKPNRDFLVTLLHLSEIGAIRFVELNYRDLFKKKSKDFAIVKVLDFDGPLTKIDEQALHFLFTTFSQTAWTTKVQTRARRRQKFYEQVREKHEQTDVVFVSDFEWWGIFSERFSGDLKEIQHEIDNEVKRLKAFEDDGPSFNVLLVMIAATLFAAIIFFNNVFPEDSAWTIEFALVIILCLGLIDFMRRRSPRANEIAAKSAALKRWLEDFSLLDERPVTDVKLWGELMVYAAAFGVAEKTLSQLYHVAPNITDDEVFANGVGIALNVIFDPGGLVLAGFFKAAGEIIGGIADGA